MTAGPIEHRRRYSDFVQQPPPPEGKLPAGIEHRLTTESPGSGGVIYFREGTLDVIDPESGVPWGEILGKFPNQFRVNLNNPNQIIRIIPACLNLPELLAIVREDLKPVLDEKFPPSVAGTEVIGKEPHTILVVDDDPVTRKILHRILEREGYRVVEAENGEGALSTLSVKC